MYPISLAGTKQLAVHAKLAGRDDKALTAVYECDFIALPALARLGCELLLGFPAVWCNDTANYDVARWANFEMCLYICRCWTIYYSGKQKLCRLLHSKTEMRFAAFTFQIPSYLKKNSSHPAVIAQSAATYPTSVRNPKFHNPSNAQAPPLKHSPHSWAALSSDSTTEVAPPLYTH